MFRHKCNRGKVSYRANDFSDDDNYEVKVRDPGREVIERNMQSRFQRIANHTKEELEKVLKRVDATLNSYEDSVQSSLVQHGMRLEDMSNVEHVNDIKELEELLNDSIAKQRYKQRLVVFIVGQVEKADEKTKLLQQINQFFIEQKQNLSAKEFNVTDDSGEMPTDVDLTLKSFDLKDCYSHVKSLGVRLNELNEEIIDYLIQNAAQKLQAKTKKKPGQITKEMKEQINSLQSKLNAVATDLISKDEKIQSLENDLTIARNDVQKRQEYNKILNDQVRQHEKEIKSYKEEIKELKDNIEEFKLEIEDLKTITASRPRSKLQDAADATTTNDEEILQKEDAQTSTSVTPEKTQVSDSPTGIAADDKSIILHTAEELSELNSLLNLTDGSEFNNITNENLPTAFDSLRQLATVRIRELLKELEINGSIYNDKAKNLQEEFDEHKITSARDVDLSIEPTTEDPIRSSSQQDSHETLTQGSNTLQPSLTDSVEVVPVERQNTFDNMATTSEQLEEDESKDRSSPDSQNNDDEAETAENAQPMSTIEEAERENDEVEPMTVSLSNSQRSEAKRTPKSVTINIDHDIIRENQLAVNEPEKQVSTPLHGSQHSSSHVEKTTKPISSAEQFKIPFFNMYEIIYKFRHAMMNLLEQNNFQSLADRLELIQPLSTDNSVDVKTDFVNNAECVLKDTVKILQACITTLQSKIDDYQKKEIEVKQTLESNDEPTIIENQESSTLKDKEHLIVDLTAKCEDLTKTVDRMHTENEEKTKQHDQLVLDQQKLINNLRLELTSLRRRLEKVEAERIVQPSIMFTRLDATRNDQTLQNAVSKGKVSQATYNELNDVMAYYTRLPSQQFINLVKRYIQFRKTVEIEKRIENRDFDKATKSVLQKMESLYERRSSQLREQMSHLRKERVGLAKTITEKFDHLEDESNIFLIRPIYSYQGRAATQTYMKLEKNRRDALAKEKDWSKKKHNPSRQSLESQNSRKRSGASQRMTTRISTGSSSDDDAPQFNIDRSVVSMATTDSGQQNSSTMNSVNWGQNTIRFGDLTRLEEFDIQRTLMPMSHTSTPLLSAFTNHGIDPCVPSLNLRSYVALSRPGIGNSRAQKPTETITRISRENISILSARSRETNPSTPFNSSAGDPKRISPPFPLIRRPLIANVASTITEKSHIGYLSPHNTNEVPATN